jgi:hypothetical protein
LHREGEVTVKSARKYWLGLAVVVLAGAGAIVRSGTAHATTTSTIYCDHVSDSGRTRYRLTATATYEDDRDAQVRRWTSFRYRLSRLMGGPVGEQLNNNVSIRIKEWDTVVFAWDSPDDRRMGQWYNLVLANPATTRLIPRDHRSKDMIEFRGIFDVPMAGDPACTAWLKVPG